MYNTKNLIFRLVYLISILILLYFLCRLVFVFINKSELDIISNFSTILIFVNGLRFDISAIFLTNLVFIVLTLWPASFTINRYYQMFLRLLFVIPNSFFVFLNIVDVAYFPYIHRRMQFNLFRFLDQTNGMDLYNQISSYLLQYWYILLFYFFLNFLLYQCYKFVVLKNKDIPEPSSSKMYSLITLLIGIWISIVSIRGGLQKKSLDIIDASELSEIQNIPAILNTPFSVIKTYNNKSLSLNKYFPEQSIYACFNCVHKPNTIKSFSNQNVVIIIVESLSKKYLSYFNGFAKTPFLDSLLSQSMVFTNGFANAKESIQGIPAILASIPSWQDEPFMFSSYAKNKVTTIANLLKAKGYHTSFFHGANNGSLGLNDYSKLAGFEKYYGRNEYNNDADFDGVWGIWDEPFLVFMTETLSQQAQPFVSAVFTLDSHNPFEIPVQFKKRFTQNGHPILPCIQYADFALSRFFEKAKCTTWFENTLFIITGDHTGLKVDNDQSEALDDYRIPIVFYKPDGSLKGIDKTVANQIDILPSIMHLLNYPDPYFSFGKDLFDNQCEHFSINYHGNVYQYIDSSYCYQFNGQNGIGYFNWNTDPYFISNLKFKSGSPNLKNCELNLKRMIQSFNNAMINDKMQLTAICQ